MTSAYKTNIWERISYWRRHASTCRKKITKILSAFAGELKKPAQI
jgi:hypothetical protein